MRGTERAIDPVTVSGHWTGHETRGPAARWFRQLPVAAAGAARQPRLRFRGRADRLVIRALSGGELADAGAPSLSTRVEAVDSAEVQNRVVREIPLLFFFGQPVFVHPDAPPHFARGFRFCCPGTGRSSAGLFF